jgi:hypothetical protein
MCVQEGTLETKNNTGGLEPGFAAVLGAAVLELQFDPLDHAGKQFPYFLAGCLPESRWEPL